MDSGEEEWMPEQVRHDGSRFRKIGSRATLVARRLTVPAILLLAIVLRALAFSPYAIHHPDEVFQYLEQAHRVAFGSGIVPWEVRQGMRSWLVPLLLAGPMRLGGLASSDPIFPIVFARFAAAAIAFAAVPAAWWLGRRISPVHGLIALFVAATWYESVYFSVHVLTEVLAVATFFVAAALLRPGTERLRMISGGALLALSVVFRFHYAPAAAVFALVLFGARWRDWRWLMLGAALMLAASGLVDLAMGQWPFGWVVENFRQNVVEDKASGFGSFGPLAYAEMTYAQWQFAFVPILALALFGARRFPALFAAALCNLAVHLLIGHKEYRFILLTTQILVFLAAIGSADLIARVRDWRSTLPAPLLYGALIALWAASSATLAFSDMSYLRWRRFEGGFQLAREAASRQACGVAIAVDNYWATGGQAFLHAATPLYFIPRRRAAESFVVTVPAYDAVIGPPDDRALPPSFRTLDCRGAGSERLCLAMRDGGCSRDPKWDILRLQQAMIRHHR
jgi:hypothetical protein